MVLAEMDSRRTSIHELRETLEEKTVIGWETSLLGQIGIKKRPLQRREGGRAGLNSKAYLSRRTSARDSKENSTLGSGWVHSGINDLQGVRREGRQEIR